MLTLSFQLPRAQRGTTMIEVLITLIILAFGLIGLASLQSKIQLGSIESYQRAQAIVLLTDMEQRMLADRSNAALFADDDVTLGTGHTDGDCADEDAGPARAKCEWSTALKGAAEVRDKNGTDTNVGAMTDARGCIKQIQTADATSGVCRPAIYQVSVAWQGLHEINSKVNANNECGKDSYGANDNFRRVIATRVAVPLLNCS